MSLPKNLVDPPPPDPVRSAGGPLLLRPRPLLSPRLTVSTSITGHSRVNWSMMVKTMILLPPKSLSWTKSIEKFWFGPINAAKGTTCPLPRHLRRRHRCNWSPSRE